MSISICHSIELQLNVTPEQREVIENPARNMYLAMGRRVGKTVGCARNRILSKIVIPNFEYCYIAPTYGQLYKEFEAFLSNADMKPLILRSKVQPFPQIWFKYSNAHLSYRSWDRPQSLRGQALDEAFVDEAQEQCYTEELIKSVLRPCLADRRGTLIFAGQLPSRSSWQYAYWLQGQRYLDDGTPNPKFKPNYYSVRVPSSAGICFQSREGRAELAEIEASTPTSIWRREYLCMPEESQNAVFPGDQIDAITTPKTDAKIDNKVRPSGESGARYIIGLDLGSHGQDYTAIVVLDCKSGIVVHAEKIPLGTLHANQAKVVAGVQQRFNNAVVVMDSTGGATGGHHKIDAFTKFYRQLVKNLKEVQLQGRQKDQMVKVLGLDLQSKAVWLPPELKDLIRETRNYEYEYVNGFYRYRAPKGQGQHDDLIMALLLATWGRSQGWQGVTSDGNPLSFF